MTFTRLLTVSFLSTAALAFAGCGDDKGATTETGTDASSETAESESETGNESAGSTGGSTDPSAGPTTDPGGSDSESGESSTGEPPPVEWGPAMGISITEVEFNQGTRQDIAIGGDWVGGPGRTIYLVKGRDSMVRVHYDVPDDWVPHQVEARLHLTYPDNTEETMTQKQMVMADSYPGELNRTFYFGLQASMGQAEPGTKFQIELYEHPDDAAGPEGIWKSPADGPNFIGFEADPMQIKVVLVPVNYQGMLAVINDQDVQDIEDWYYEFNPVQEVLLEVHEPLVVNQGLNGLSPLLSLTSQLRQQENPDPNVYYHAMLNQGCQFFGCGNGGLLGQAIDIPGPLMSQAGGRVASSMYHKNGNGRITEMTLETIVHEHGHTQGQFHIFCPGGGAAGTDPSYPDPDGKTTAWGFGMRNFKLHSPTAEYDYMSYCRPQWFGPWTWNKTYDRIRALTSWDFGKVEAEETYPVLVGAYHEDGTTDWWTIDGALYEPRVSATDHVEFAIDGEVVSQPVEIRELSETDAYWIFTPLPGPIDSIESIKHLEGDLQIDVDVDLVKPLHNTTNFVSN